MAFTEPEKISRIQNALLLWGKENSINYPWRYVLDPYQILTSEFMLHRTQSDQVVPVYTSLLLECPDLAMFYNKSSDFLLSLLKPLGLNWRNKNMINALKSLYEHYQEIPIDKEKLMAINGVGQYIAGATLCFCLNKPEILVDVNIVRVTGRVLGINLGGEARRRKEIREGVELLLFKKDPRKYYYSIIDLAHQLCKPKNPRCDQCPLSPVHCHYASKKSST